jgi:site-specific DNA recombinase
LRFAFYGRMSTEDFQDYKSSRAWQCNVAEELIADKGAVVVEFFDRGHSRRTPWSSRPQAAALLAALADPGRGFDAVVVGEYERAFVGDQLTQLLPLLARHRVQLWLPETNGPVDGADPTHQALIMLLGTQSKREVLRSRFRVLAAMQAQVREQGRYLGGRPPYGYRLADAGPHPNTAHARWGRRLQRLEPDPVTAGHVQWIFAQRLAGRSASSIAHELNDRGVACPSSADPARNPHRTGAGWTLRTVATILANPRYTGRQIWNRQRIDYDPAADRRGQRAVLRWNQPQDWVISKTLAHPALVSEDDFIAAQTVTAIPAPADRTTRTYTLVGLLRCRTCGRRMDSHWVHQRPGYRCRHGHASAKSLAPDRPKTLYLREDHIFARLTRQLDQVQVCDQTALLDPTELANYLRAQDITILCDIDTCTLDTSAPDGPEVQLIT